MKKIIYLILFLPSLVFACKGYVIGFKGQNNVFDSTAFVEYANKLDYCSKSFSWQGTEPAKKLIKNITVPYHLYGYSQGAVAVKNILEQKDIPRPEFVITIGAYRTADVNFNKYNVKYINYFDNSGRGQNGPGIFLSVSHSDIQKEVNKLIWGQ